MSYVLAVPIWVAMTARPVPTTFVIQSMVCASTLPRPSIPLVPIPPTWIMFLPTLVRTTSAMSGVPVWAAQPILDKPVQRQLNPLRTVLLIVPSPFVTPESVSGLRQILDHVSIILPQSPSRNVRGGLVSLVPAKYSAMLKV
jgi:hypothetical protein